MIVAETMIWERGGHVTKEPTWLGHFLQSRKPPQLAETGRGGRSVDGRSQSAVLELVQCLLISLFTSTITSTSTASFEHL